jgi:hypothetical protein
LSWVHKEECEAIKVLFAEGSSTATLKDSTTVRLLLRAVLAWKRHEQDVSEAPEGVLPTVSLDDYGATAESLFSLALELEEHEFDCPEALWGAFQDIAKQLKYIVPPRARRGLEDYVGMLCRLYCNTFVVSDSRPGRSKHTVGVGLWPTGSLFNHSCAPNCSFSHVGSGGKLVVTAVKGVEEGEELFISYLNTAQSTEHRRKHLFKSFFFVCQCPRCERDRQGKRKWEEISQLRACVECAEASGDGETADIAGDRLAELTNDGEYVWRGWQEGD